MRSPILRQRVTHFFAQSARKSNTNHMGVSVFEGNLKGNPRKKTHYLMLVWGGSPKKRHRHIGQNYVLKRRRRK